MTVGKAWRQLRCAECGKPKRSRKRRMYRRCFACRFGVVMRCDTARRYVDLGISSNINPNA